jgi:hypothetical protein
MVFIIGVDHRFQHNGDNKDINNDLRLLKDEFYNYLIGKVNILNIKLIAEEYNDEVLNQKKKWFGATDSLGRLAALSMRIDHIFCDPNSEERRELGIPSGREIKINLFGTNREPRNNYEKKLIEEEKKKYWHIREKYWLEKIRNKMQEPIIFICGTHHSERFKSLIANNSYKAKIITRDWEEDRT